MSILLSALTEVFFFPLTYPSFFFLFPPVRLPEGQATLSLSITQLLFMMSALFYQLTIILLSHIQVQKPIVHVYTLTLYVYIYAHIHAHCMCTSIHCIQYTQLHVRTSTVYTYSMYIHINAYSKYLYTVCINAHIVHHIHIVHVLAHIQCIHRQTCTHFVYVDI